MTTSAIPATGTQLGVSSLIEFALEALPAMRLSDGAFCFERRAGQSAPLGRSPRYTLMVELGLLKARDAGYALPFNVDELESVAWHELREQSLSPGDVGLMLWIDARRRGGNGTELVGRLAGALRVAGGLPACLGMELGWIVTGLAHHMVEDGSAAGARLLQQSLNQLLVENLGPRDLFRHFGAPGWRRRFPNFATQIYSVLALAIVGRAGLTNEHFQPPALRLTGCSECTCGWRLAMVVRR